MSKQLTKEKIHTITSISFASILLVLTVQNTILLFTGDVPDSRYSSFFFFATFLILFAIFFLTIFIKNRFTYTLQPATLLVIAIITIIDTQELAPEMGEYLFFFSMFLIVKYNLYFLSRIRFTILSIILYTALRITIAILLYNTDLSEVFQFFLYTSVFSVGFIFLFLSKSDRTASENESISAQLMAEQKFRDIGKQYYTDLVHNLNSADLTVSVRKIEEYIKKDNTKRALDYLENHKEMIDHLNMKYNSIRERVISSRETKPETISVYNRLSKRYPNGVVFKPADKKIALEIAPCDFFNIVEPIIDNAIYEAATQPVVSITTKSDKVLITVSNDGDKIPWARKYGYVSKNWFYPGKTTKKGGSGWGVYSSVQKLTQLKGNMLIKSTDNETTFTIVFSTKKLRKQNEKK